ncbi:hypothetical protein H4F49_05175 [Pectobacterium polaris]|nr:hypothetical protein [Pectobacterium polaris]MBN3080019.1 hypothetical protein [Pectobacterium polaris]
MQNIIQILELLLTWPTVVILALLLLRNPLILLLRRITDSTTAKAKIGFMEIEVGELARKGKAAVDIFNELSLTMGKTRLLELEVTKENFSMNFSHAQQNTLNMLIIELQEKLDFLEKEIHNENISIKK